MYEQPHWETNIYPTSSTVVDVESLPVYRPLIFTRAPYGPPNIPVWCNDSQQAVSIYGNTSWVGIPLSKYNLNSDTLIKRILQSSGTWICRVVDPQATYGGILIGVVLKQQDGRINITYKSLTGTDLYPYLDGSLSQTIGRLENNPTLEIYTIEEGTFIPLVLIGSKYPGYYSSEYYANITKINQSATYRLKLYTYCKLSKTLRLKEQHPWDFTRLDTDKFTVITYHENYKYLAKTITGQPPQKGYDYWEYYDDLNNPLDVDLNNSMGIIQVVGGCDGTTHSSGYVETIEDICKGNITPELVDSGRYPITHLEDGDYPIEVKNRLIDLTAIMDSIIVNVGVYDDPSIGNYKNHDITALSKEDRYIGIAKSLVERARLTRESTKFNTSVIRVNVHSSVGEINGRLEGTQLWLADQTAKIDNASFIKQYALPIQIGDYYEALYWVPPTKTMREYLFTNNINYVIHDTSRTFKYTHLHSVHPSTDSVLVEAALTRIIVYCKHLYRLVHSKYSGRVTAHNELKELLLSTTKEKMNNLLQTKLTYNATIDDELKVTVELFAPTILRSVIFDMEVGTDTVE